MSATRDELHARASALITTLTEDMQHGGDDNAERRHHHDETRDALLWDLGEFQRAHIPAYGRLWASRNGSQHGRRTGQAPAVPTDVFRYARMAVHPTDDDIALFRTSGTTSGARGAHAFRDLSLYHQAAESAARYALFPDLGSGAGSSSGGAPRQSMRLLSVTPDAAALPDSSLSHMLSRFFHWFGDEGSHFCVGGGPVGDPGALLPDVPGLVDALRRATAERTPVALLGTSFALVLVLDALAAEGLTLALPPGSRVMQTGGFKGKTREIEPGEMRDALTTALGVPAPFIVAEYGMTELSSQMYETTLRDALRGQPLRERALWVPPWVRVSPVDPEHLEPRPAGEPGLLRIDDVANLDSVAAIQTSDRACLVRLGDPGRYLHLLGRAQGAVARGCSLALEEALGS